MTLQQQIIKALGAKPQINAEEEIRRSVDFLKSYLQTYPFIKSLVLGISGGQDSTLAGKLCQMAINELRQETGNESLQFIAVRLPMVFRLTNKIARMPLPLFNRIAY
ncbi:NH3-dependent NAD(+) synthetase [Escherichia coli]|nr:NH3-dependent NAD(+) synthetase [Escherichia coli]